MHLSRNMYVVFLSVAVTMLAVMIVLYISWGNILYSLPESDMRFCNKFRYCTASDEVLFEQNKNDIYVLFLQENMLWVPIRTT